MMKELEVYEIMEVCLLAGKIMLESGGETYRVEDTMTRIASAYGIHFSHSFVTPTGIIFSFDGYEPTKLVRISKRTTDLHKVTVVNSISRRISSGSLPIREAYAELKILDQTAVMFPLWLQILAAALASGCFLIMFNGEWRDFLPAFATGGFAFSCFVLFNKYIDVKFFSEFLSALIIGILSFLFITMNLGTELDKIIIGSVMPLVPGVLITNAVRDLMAGHLVSGLSKGAEAFLTACAIGTGIAVVFAIIN